MVGSVVLTVTDSGPGNRLERLSDGVANSRHGGAFQSALLAFLKGGLPPQPGVGSSGVPRSIGLSRLQR